MNNKEYDTEYIDYLSEKELKQLLHYANMLKLSNKLMPLATIGYALSISAIIVKYVITNDFVLSVRSFIIPQVFTIIVLYLSIKLGRYSIDNIKMLENIGNTRYLREMFNRKLNS